MANESEMKAPATFLEAVRFFADEEDAIQFLADVRWPDGEQVCPKCGTVGRHYWLKNQRRWRCREKACRRQFSIKVGTIFEDSPIKLSQWLPAVWLLVNCKNDISSYELSRHLGVTQKTAWFMLQRIREALRMGSFEKMDGEVEVDETYIGGKAKNMHIAKRKRVNHGTGGHDKTAVMGLLERPHDHVHEYVRGRVHTNGIENFWSLLKRTIGGTYVSIEFGNAPPWVDRDLLERLRDLNRPVGRTVSRARVRRRGQQVTLSAELRAKIDLILAPEETFEGSVKGDLEAINVHDNNNTFRIYPSAGPGRVTCHFPDNLRDQAISAIDQLVIVHGVLRYKANARFPDEIDVRDIEVVEQPDDLPTLTELRGIARGAPGDLTAAEYVRGLRDGWD